MPGRVTAQAYYADRYGGYWGDEVRWIYRGQSYDDALTLTDSRQHALPTVGATVQVLVDRARCQPIGDPPDRLSQPTLRSIVIERTGPVGEENERARDAARIDCGVVVETLG